MRPGISALLLAGVLFCGTSIPLWAAEKQLPEDATTDQDTLSNNDRQVIRHMELLALMDLLKDMDMLAAEPKSEPEDEQ